MSFGFRSEARLGDAVPLRFDPPVSELLVLRVELLIGTPSTTKSGWPVPERERTPRIWTRELAPASPDCCSILTLGSLPASAWTRFVSLAREMTDESTALRWTPRRSNSLDVPAPVTTISPSWSGLAARVKLTVTVPAASATDWVTLLKPR